LFTFGQIDGEPQRVCGRNDPWKFHLVVGGTRFDVPIELHCAGVKDFKALDAGSAGILSPSSNAGRFARCILPVRIFEDEREISDRQKEWFFTAGDNVPLPGAAQLAVAVETRR